jgi:hypothetical protein
LGTATIIAADSTQARKRAPREPVDTDDRLRYNGY